MPQGIVVQFTIDEKGAVKNIRTINKELRDTEKAGGQAEKGLSKISSGLGKLNSLMAGAGSMYLLNKLKNSFMEAANNAEQYQTRLGVLLRSQNEGNRMFEEMAKYASKVPHTYDQIMGSATNLAGVMRGGVNEVTKWMPLIGDLAATTGLSVQDTTSQVIRMYSAGAASADMFRERGVLAMMGFQAGVSYSAEETRKKMMDEWQKADSQFRGATDKLAETWKGKTSMLSDAWFQFRTDVMNSGVMDWIKKEVDGVISKIEEMKKSGKFEDFAQNISDNIVGSLGNAKNIFNDLLPIVKTLGNTLGTAIEGFNSLPGWVKEYGVIAAVFTGKKGMLALGGLSYLSSDKFITDIAEKSNEDAAELRKKLGLPDDFQFGPKYGLLARKEYGTPLVSGIDKIVNMPNITTPKAEILYPFIEDIKTRSSKEAKVTELPFEGIEIKLPFEIDQDILKNNIKESESYEKERRSLWIESRELMIEQATEGYDTQKELLKFHFDAEFGLIEEHDERRILAAQILAMKLGAVDEEQSKVQIKFMEDRVASFAQTWGSMLYNAQTQAGNTFDNITRMFKNMMEQMAVYSAMGGLFSLITGGTFVKGAGIAIKSMFPFLEKRATGGPVMAGGLYRVNEREPEFFQPYTSGKVIPLSKMTSNDYSVGNINVTVINQNRELDPQQVADAIEKAVYLRKMKVA